MDWNRATQSEATWDSRAIGVIVKRDAVVRGLGSTILHYRHPNRPTHGRFIRDDCLVVMEAETGRLWAHYLANVPRKPNSLFARSSNSIIGSGEPQTTLHHGTCVGRAIPLPEFYIMPDGRKLYCDTSSLTRGNQNNELRISDGGVSFQIPLGEGTRFVTISDEWERLIVSRGSAIEMYDLRKVFGTAILGNGLIAALTLPRGASSAMFLGKDVDTLVVTDYSNRVTSWKYDPTTRGWISGELFHGEHPIAYAETNDDGRQLLIIESVSSGDAEIRGSVYSVETGVKWYDLGSDYKWFGATFLNKHEVGVSKHWVWTNVFPILPFSSLVQLAREELSVIAQ